MNFVLYIVVIKININLKTLLMNIYDLYDYVNAIEKPLNAEISVIAYWSRNDYG
jgi:hypothetical protein